MIRRISGEVCPVGLLDPRPLLDPSGSREVEGTIVRLGQHQT